MGILGCDHGVPSPEGKGEEMAKFLSAVALVTFLVYVGSITILLISLKGFEFLPFIVAGVAFQGLIHWSILLGLAKLLDQGSVLRVAD